MKEEMHAIKLSSIKRPVFFLEIKLLILEMINVFKENFQTECDETLHVSLADLTIWIVHNTLISGNPRQNNINLLNTIFYSRCNSCPSCMGLLDRTHLGKRKIDSTQGYRKGIIGFKELVSEPWDRPSEFPRPHPMPESKSLVPL